MLWSDAICAIGNISIHVYPYKFQGKPVNKCPLAYSVIDIAIIKARKKDYFKMIDTKYFLEEKLNKKIDMGYYDSIRPIIRKRIEKDLIYV